MALRTSKLQVTKTQLTIARSHITLRTLEKWRMSCRFGMSWRDMDVYKRCSYEWSRIVVANQKTVCLEDCDCVWHTDKKTGCSMVNQRRLVTDFWTKGFFYVMLVSSAFILLLSIDMCVIILCRWQLEFPPRRVTKYRIWWGKGVRSTPSIFELKDDVKFIEKFWRLYLLRWISVLMNVCLRASFSHRMKLSCTTISILYAVLLEILSKASFGLPVHEKLH